MKRALTMILVVAPLTVCRSIGGAQPIADHLKCYRIKDPQAKASYTADLTGLVVEPGCKITVPAVTACVPATKTNVVPTPPGGGATGTPNSFFCYKVKCPRATLPTLPGYDQFGNRTVAPKTAHLLCAPLAPAPGLVDNGDGTVTDRQTGLQWEKKVAGSGCTHCVNDTYTWSNSGIKPDGPAFTDFLGFLNYCSSNDGTLVINPGFAGHCDWRFPTIQELKTIVDLSAAGCGSGNPCIDPVFGPTAASFYWSSSTFASFPLNAWSVNFDGGSASNFGKAGVALVRAVRGGS